jgi:hypothetical protein
MRHLVAGILCACTSTSNATPRQDVTTHAPAGGESRKVSPPAVKPIGDPANAARVIAVQVVAAVDDGAASTQPAYARADQRVTLYAVVTAELSGRRTVYSDAPKLHLGNKRVTTESLAKAPVVELRWNRIEPAVNDMSNGATPADFHFETIDYRATPIDATGGQLTADVRPTLTPDHGNGVGTMRFQLVVLQGERVIASAGPEARRGRGSGGLTDGVLRVSIRRDDTYLGYMTEMYNQPYIWASGGISDTQHQSEHLEGSDCADLMIYGQRRMGSKVAYTWTGGLPNVTKRLGAGTRSPDGIYRDGAGKPLPFTQVGDLVLFPRHVGALAADRGTLGVLDDQDLMMHTLFDSPKEQAIADSGYADKPVELRRFR